MTADVVVIGLGAAGSAALYHLARQGVRAVGIDRFTPPHTMGSTHGGSRIIRKAYFEGEQYVPVLSRAYTLWDSLEREAQQHLITWCGCLNIAPRDSPMITRARRSANAAGIETRLMTPEEIQEAFPAFHLQTNEAALFEPQAGAIHPERAVRAHLSQAQSCGATTCFDEPVRAIERLSGGVQVRTDTRSVHAGKAVITAGAWIRSLLGDDSPPVTIERVVNAWFATEGTAFAPERCPTFIWEYQGAHSYGFPNLGFGLKAGLHYQGGQAFHPRDVTRTVHDDETQQLRDHHLRLFPRGLEHCVQAATCLYTNTPDKHYLIDYLGGSDRRVVVGSACSGHGFKSSSAVGEALACLAMDQVPPIPIDAFRWRWPQS